MVRDARQSAGPLFRAGRHRLREGVRSYAVLQLHEPLPEKHELVPRADPMQLEAWLRRLAQDPVNQQVLRELSAGLVHAPAHGLRPASEAVRQVALQLSEGRLRLAEALPLPLPRLPRTRVGEAPLPPPPSAEERHMISLQIVDDVTDEPISGVKLRIKLPNGSTQPATSDGAGTVRVSNVPPGNVEVRSVIDGATLADTLAYLGAGPRSAQARTGARPKSTGRFLAQLTAHKVSDGETLESIAQFHGMTKNQLTQFNWGTTSPKEIQKRLFLDVGCKRTDGSGQLLLTSDAKPGVLFIPKPVVLSVMAPGPQRVLRVGKEPAPPVFRFSA